MNKVTLVSLCLIVSFGCVSIAGAADRAGPGADASAVGGSYATEGEEGILPAPLRRPIPAAAAPARAPFQLDTLNDQGCENPVSLASDDFDGDGVPDLVVGCEGTGGSHLALYRGNVDSIFPNSEAARQRRAEGGFSDRPFVTPPTVFPVGIRPDFLAAGDFDNDGNRDVVAGTSEGTSLVLMAGDGAGVLQEAEAIALPGRLTAMVAGDVNRRDGLVDLVIAVVGAEGSAALVFEGLEGVFHSVPEIVALPAPATDLAVGPLTSYAAFDLVVGAGRQLVIVKGRDRKTYLGPERQAQIGPPEVVEIELDGMVRAVATGDFTTESAGHEIAALLEEGTLRLFARDPATDGWQVAGEHHVATFPTAARSLRPARMTGSITHDLVVLDPVEHRLVTIGGGAIIGNRDLAAAPTAVLPMRLTPDALMDLVILEEGRAPRVALTSPAAVITVDSASDMVMAGDGACSLREAIANANGDTDTTAGDCTAGAGADAIQFNVGGGGVPVAINLMSPLPAIVDSLTIDGDTQACSPGPCVELIGGLAGLDVDGLSVTAGSTTVRGLVVRDFDARGIVLQSAGNFIEGTFVGTDRSGTVASGNNGAGILSEGVDNTIGGTASGAGNLVSANGGNGVKIKGPSGAANLVVGNYVGTDVGGTAALGNVYAGVLAKWSPGNVIGGTSANARNLISGNELAGVNIDQPEAVGNLAQGNYLGTDVTGTLAVPDRAGVAVVNGAADNTIGGTAVGAGNLCSGNTWGIVNHNGATGNLAIGNLVGTDVTGTVALSNDFTGVQIELAPGNTVGGAIDGPANVISGNLYHGVVVWYPASSSNEIFGNYIGTDLTGTQPIGNLIDGILVIDASETTIGGAEPWAGNVVSDNNRGVVIQGPSGNPSLTATLNEVRGNFIGTDVTGTSDLGNVFHGVVIKAPDNTVGGTLPGERNVISGNDGVGVWIRRAEATGNQVVGNYIGVDVTGAAPLGNTGFAGVRFADGASDNTVGGTTPDARNIISANTRGVLFDTVIATGTKDNHVLGNFIGVDASGTAVLGNALAGILIEDGEANTIGGTTAGSANVISGNGANGVAIVAQNGGAPLANEIVGNLIGTDVTGTVMLGNVADGVIVQDSSRNVVGGTTPGAGNLITGNGECGVEVYEATPGTTSRNAILGNSIVSNVGMGIDHGDDGVTTNDPGDADAGPNLLQNFPVVTVADATPTGITIDGTYNSRPTRTFRLEFFTSTECDDSGCGEGERYLGTHDVATDASGDATFSVNLAVPVSDGDSITSTATDGSDNTSEFSDCFVATCQSFVTLGQVLDALDRGTMVWASASDVRFVKGDLAAVATYSTTADGTLFGATSLDISGDNPGVGAGLYYLVRPLGCGSWQNALGSEPARDPVLP